MADSRIRTNFWNLEDKEVFTALESQPGGLTEAEAADRFRSSGPNEIAEKERRSGFRILLSQFANSFVLVLIGAAAIAWFLQDRADSLVILVIVILSTLLGFFQEYRAEKALRELKKLITLQTKVIRDGELTVVEAKRIVPGDVIVLEIGDLVPADLRVFQSHGLTTDESSLTGESLPVVKTIGPLKTESALPQDLSNMAFMGTTVGGGGGRGVVVATGKATYLGRTASLMKETPHEGDFQKSIRKFSRLMLWVVLAMTLFIFAANALLAKGIFSSFLFALALAVGITPEILPIIVTITLSRGAVRLAKEKVVVKRLVSVEDLGNIDVLCCDKTGTLTKGEVTLSDYRNLEGKREDRLVLYGLLSSPGVPERGRALAGNPIDRAVWNHEKAKSLAAELGQYGVLGSNEFDFERRRTSVLVEGRDRTALIAKGAPESILKACTSAQVGGQNVELTQDLISSIAARIAAYESDGLRTIALATKAVEAKTTSPEDEKGLVLLGFLLFLDPPKKTVKASLDMLGKLGVEVKVVSGDAAAVTRKICGEVRLRIVDDRILTGEELESLTPEKFKEAICRYNVFARVSPAQKHRIVEGLGKEGHIVGFLGDGANDAPALRAADVGISVDTGSGIAKASADIILLRKSLRVLARGITEGRKTFANITKYILNTISANYGNMFTVAFSSLFLKFIPLPPSQILLNNLVSDIPMLTVSTDRVDEDSLKRPRKWNIRLISRFMVVFGLLSSVFDLILILLLIFAIKASTGLFRTAWFIESLFSELVITFSIRTRSIFVKSRPSGALFFSSLFCGLAAVALVFSAVGHSWFEFVRVPPEILGFIVGVIALYFAAVEAVKRVFFKRFKD